MKLDAPNAKAAKTPDQAEVAGRDPKDLLRSAAGAIAAARTDHSGNDPYDTAEQEIRALARFGQESGLILAEAVVQCWFADKKNCIEPGLEHKVVVQPERHLVVKDYDTRLFDEETCEIFYKPAELVFDYLTDHLLANHLFGDDIRLAGLLEMERGLHVFITQPYVVGKHPEWEELVASLEAQGLEQEASGSTKGHFWVDGGSAGPILVTDVHEDNVIVDRFKFAHLIDVHFKFDSRAARLAVLNSLGLL